MPAILRHVYKTDILLRKAPLHLR